MVKKCIELHSLRIDKSFMQIDKIEKKIEIHDQIVLIFKWNSLSFNLF
jgi:hypothetical protein